MVCIDWNSARKNSSNYLFQFRSNVSERIPYAANVPSCPQKLWSSCNWICRIAPQPSIVNWSPPLHAIALLPFSKCIEAQVITVTYSNVREYNRREEKKTYLKRTLKENISLFKLRQGHSIPCRECSLTIYSSQRTLLAICLNADLEGR